MTPTPAVTQCKMSYLTAILLTVHVDCSICPPPAQAQWPVALSPLISITQGEQLMEYQAIYLPASLSL